MRAYEFQSSHTPHTVDVCQDAHDTYAIEMVHLYDERLDCSQPGPIQTVLQ